MDAMRFDEYNIFATTKEDLRQVIADVPRGDATTGACESEGTENSGRISKQSPDIAGWSQRRPC